MSLPKYPFAPRREHPQRRGRVRLFLEVLEERTVLSSGLDRPSGALSYTNTEVVAAIKSPAPLSALAAVLDTPQGHNLSGAIQLSASRTMPSLPGETLVEIALANGADPQQVVSDLSKLAIVSWASPNYVYDASVLTDPREMTPNDPSYASQYHHQLMKNNLAWDSTMGRASIVIGITDDGTDLAHVDLYDNIWINQQEIPAAYLANLTDLDGDGRISMRDLNNVVNKGAFKSNDVNGNGRIDGLDLIAGISGSGTAGWSDGIDNNGNGYTDDIVGWDFSANDLNPNGGTHGTHVAGIAAAHTNNAIGVSGTAGNATIMPIRFYGSGAWTSTVIYNSYAYAANYGVKILTTSYNVDGFAGDPTFVAALNYIYSHGVLHFNSAGNGGANNPPRTQYDQTLYVVSTDNQDKKAGTSNYGTLTDISAPGVSIYSTYPPNTYDYNSGTSMAAPNAAGAAALIWSLHPTWTRDQVAAQLLGTADNINAQNPAYQNLLGAGRVNSHRALTENLKPPKFDAVIGLPNEGGTHNGRLYNFEIDLGGVFSTGSMMNLANWQLRWAGFDGVLNNADDRLFPLTLNTSYMVGTNRFKFAVNRRTPAGLYQFKAFAGGLVNPFGTPLDGNGNGVGGDHFTRNFYIGLGFLPGAGDGRGFAGTALTRIGPKTVTPIAVPPIVSGPDSLAPPITPAAEQPDGVSATSVQMPHRALASLSWLESLEAQQLSLELG
jgi:subtilisin family serine protease